MSAKPPAIGAAAPRPEAWRELFDGGTVAHVLGLLDAEIGALQAGASPELHTVLRRELLGRLDAYMQQGATRGGAHLAAASALYTQTLALSAQVEAGPVAVDAAALRAAVADFRAAWQDLRAEGASHEVYEGQPTRQIEDQRRSARDAARQQKDDAQRQQKIDAASGPRKTFRCTATQELLTPAVLRAKRDAWKAAGTKLAAFWLSVREAYAADEDGSRPSEATLRRMLKQQQ